MKHLQFLILLVVPLFWACEKVIDVDLNDVAPEIVIEGNVSDYPDFASVKISRTSSFFDNSESEKVSGALVTIFGASGEGTLLKESGNGVYTSREIMVVPQTKYRMVVEVEGREYTGESTMQPMVRLDSLGYYYEESLSFFESGYVLQMYFADPAASENYYRVKVSVNDTLQNNSGNLYIFSDRFTNGKPLEVTIRDLQMEEGDTVRAQLISLDKAVYDYYDTFEDLMFTNPGSAAPANPNTNLTNGALGYFSAWSSDSRTTVIK